MSLHSEYTETHWKALTDEQRCAADKIQVETSAVFRNISPNEVNRKGPAICLCRQDSNGETFFYYTWENDAWLNLPDLTWHYKNDDATGRTNMTAGAS